MTDMRRFINIAESKIDEFVDPISAAATIGAASALGVGVRAGYSALQFRKTVRMQEAAQLYHSKNWTIDQIVHKYWPRINANNPKWAKLQDRVKQWIVWRGFPLRPGDERKGWDDHG